MTEIPHFPVIGDNTEVPTLIEILNKAGQRLEEITAGEIDSVAGIDGRMYVLQHAQEQLRNSDTIRQAAILNSLPAHIALLNAQGIIVSVNEGWEHFAKLNMCLDSKKGVGANYLEICDHAIGRDAAEAPQVAEGIRSVLDGNEQTFMISYPCHSPTQHLWFLMTATTYPSGAVVMHSDIT
jgi:PAS domain-containing protein